MHKAQDLRTNNSAEHDFENDAWNWKTGKQRGNTSGNSKTKRNDNQADDVDLAHVNSARCKILANPDDYKPYRGLSGSPAFRNAAADLGYFY